MWEIDGKRERERECVCVRERDIEREGERGCPCLDRSGCVNEGSSYLMYISCTCWLPGYTGTSLIRNRHPVGAYTRTMPRPLWWSKGG